jgi:hypothetical protein
MRLIRTILVSLSCLFLAIAAVPAWAQPDAVSAALSSHPPAGSLHALPVELSSRGPAGSNTSRPLPAELSSKPATKQPGTRSQLSPGIHPHSGGENLATATPISALPYTDAGNTCASLDDYTGACFTPGGPDVVYVYTPQTDECVHVSLCGSTYDTAMIIAEDTSGNIIACNDDFCGSASDLSNVPLRAGHAYYIIVDGFSVSCGNYLLAVEACPPPPPPLECPPGAIQENEPVCADEYLDTYNAGCNSTPPTFFNLDCTPGTVNVCGTYGNYLYQGLMNRDTDWYQFTVNGTTNVHFCATGEAPTAIFLLNGSAGCAGLSVVCSNSGEAGQELCCDATLGSGTYWLFVGTSGFSGTPCGSRYSMSLTRDACPPPFVFECPSGAIPEGEPVCADEYLDTYNAGCNSAPPTFFNLDCTPGTVKVCGTYGNYLYQGLQNRDTDWYQFTVNATTNVHFCAIGEAPTAIFILNGSAGCAGLSVVCSNSGGVGQEICCDATLGSGTYWLFVGTSGFSGIACGSRYLMSLTRDACPPPFVFECPSGAIQEGEPVCGDGFQDLTNDGCNSVPPAFNQVPCSNAPIEMCGTYGTYFYQGLQYRDTDWYELLLTQPRHIRFCVVGEAATTAYILNGTAGCTNIGVECFVAGGSGQTICCEADLLPGTHWLFVATTDFAGVPCGSRYAITISGDSCFVPTAVETGTPLGELAIRGVKPNPSTGASLIDYELPRAASMRLEVFDVAGHRVRVLLGQHIAPAGTGSARWDGRGDRGQLMPAGAYYVRLAVESKVLTRALIVVK